MKHLPRKVVFWRNQGSAPACLPVQYKLMLLVNLPLTLVVWVMKHLPRKVVFWRNQGSTPACKQYMLILS